MNDSQAADHTWEQCKAELEPHTWTIGEHATFYGFFLSGWHARAAWDSHKASECQRLANEKEKLRAENERLVGELKWIVDHYDPTAPEIAHHRAKDAIAPNAHAE